MIHYKYWIALERAHGIGHASLKEIFDTTNTLSISIEDIFSCTDQEIRNEFSFNQQILAGIAEAQLSLESIEDEYLSLVQAGIRVTMFFESAYPQTALSRLGTLSPSILYSIGELALVSENITAFISHSETSEKGDRIAWNSASQLSAKGITIAGGLSKGAVTSAHVSALEHGGKTIAVIPCGFLTFELSERLKKIFDPDRFLIISPFQPHLEYNQFNAMARNRFLCSLAQAVFIVESTNEGGTIEAAKSAHKLAIPIYTAEYSEYPKSAEGNPILIKDFGAIPVRGKREGETVMPNIDHILSTLKFGTKS